MIVKRGTARIVSAEVSCATISADRQKHTKRASAIAWHRLTQLFFITFASPLDFRLINRIYPHLQQRNPAIKAVHVLLRLLIRNAILQSGYAERLDDVDEECSKIFFSSGVTLNNYLSSTRRIGHIVKN